MSVHCGKSTSIFSVDGCFWLFYDLNGEGACNTHNFSKCAIKNDFGIFSMMPIWHVCTHYAQAVDRSSQW